MTSHFPNCKIGDRIRLIVMGDDPCPIPAGTTGTITSIQDVSKIMRKPDVQVGVKWDIQRSLSLIWPVDKFEVIE